MTNNPAWLRDAREHAQQLLKVLLDRTSDKTLKRIVREIEKKDFLVMLGLFIHKLNQMDNENIQYLVTPDKEYVIRPKAGEKEN